jgi:hypothetical protein
VTPVAVEKLHFLQTSKNLGDRKCLGKLRKSFVGHPDTILFSQISRGRVFQLLKGDYTNYAAMPGLGGQVARGSTSVMATLRQ